MARVSGPANLTLTLVQPEPEPKPKPSPALTLEPNPSPSSNPNLSPIALTFGAGGDVGGGPGVKAMLTGCRPLVGLGLGLGQG